MQARENRGARYRVTNSAIPEIHPFIGAHQVRGCIQEKPRPPTRISILSHRRQPWGSGNRTTQCATEIHEKKNKKERKGKRVRRNVDRRDEVGRNCEPTKRVRREMLRERKAGKDQEGKE